MRQGVCHSRRPLPTPRGDSFGRSQDDLVPVDRQSFDHFVGQLHAATIVLRTRAPSCAWAVTEIDVNSATAARVPHNLLGTLLGNRVAVSGPQDPLLRGVLPGEHLVFPTSPAPGVIAAIPSIPPRTPVPASPR